MNPASSSFVLDKELTGQDAIHRTPVDVRDKTVLNVITSLVAQNNNSKKKIKRKKIGEKLW